MNRSRFLTLIAGGKKKPFNSDRFVLLVDSEESGVSGSDQFEITGAGVGTGTTFPVRFSPEADPFDFTDVTVDVSDPTITFPSAGRYFVQIGQPFDKLEYDRSGDALKVIASPLQWGNIQWSSLSRAFEGCNNLDDTIATDIPNLTNLNNIQFMFSRTGFNVPINSWDVSNVENMQFIFRTAFNFNQYIGDWDISNLSTVGSVFRDSGMSCENYTDTLVAWINQAFERTPNAPINLSFAQQDGMTFATSRSGGANFADAGEARALATTPVADGGLGWTISGDTVQTNC